MKPFGDHEVFRGAAVRLLNQLQRLDQRDLDILLLDQRRERLGGDFCEAGEEVRAFALGEGSGDLDGIRGFEGGDVGQLPIPCLEEPLVPTMKPWLEGFSDNNANKGGRCCGKR